MSRSARCKECRGHSVGGPGLTPNMSIVHEESCSAYPSAGQRQRAEHDEDRRRFDVAAAAVKLLIEAGYQAEVDRFGAGVVLDADVAARLAEVIRDQ